MKRFLFLTLALAVSFGMFASAANATTTIGTNINTGGTLTVTGTSTLTGNASLAGTLTVTGAATMTDITAAGTIIADKNNATAFRIKGASSSTSASNGADIQSYTGMFTNADYDNAASLGTKENRLSYGANYDMDLVLQGPHQVRIVAADNTVTGGDATTATTNGVGNILMISRSDIKMSPWSLAEGVGDNYLQVSAVTESVATAGTGTYNGGEITLETNSGTLVLQPRQDYVELWGNAGKKLETTSDGVTVSGTLIADKDNATSFRLKGASSATSASAGADIQSYSGIFTNADYDSAAALGTKENRVTYATNYDQDLVLQTPHQLRLVAADNNVTTGAGSAGTQNGVGNILMISRSDVKISPWSAPEGIGTNYLQVSGVTETVADVAGAGYVAGEITLETNSGTLILQPRQDYVELWGNASKRFETTSTGATVTGNLTVTGTLIGNFRSAASADGASVATEPSETCGATTVGNLMLVDETDAANAWLWACEQTGASSYAWIKIAP